MSRLVRYPALALGLFVLGVMLLTASGHTYSPDEESIVYVAQSFVTRGDFDIPNPDQYPVVGGHRGAGGKLYSGTGIGSSLVSLPLYVIADAAAGAFEPHDHAFILRLVLVSLFNSLITALTAMLLYAWLRGLGASTRGALALALVFAFGTAAWVYARSFYAESLLALWFLLSGYGVFRFHATRRPFWMIVAGLAAGFAALTKVQGVLVLPALGLYFLALEFPLLRRRLYAQFLAPGLFFLFALGCGLALVGYLSWVRFGDPFQTGHGTVEQAAPLLTGLYGMLLSSGKSIFLYAPPALLTLFALPGFARRRPAETALIVSLTATVALFHARIQFWAGDGAWGPRYLVATLPFWILPLGALAAEWWQARFRRVALVGLAALGLVVNLLGITVDWSTYIQIQPNEAVRHFDPPASPILAQAGLFAGRARAWWGAVVDSGDAFVPVRGLLGTPDEELLPRYLAPRATVLVKSNQSRALQMTLVANDYRAAREPRRSLLFFSNGALLPAQNLPTGDPGILRYRVEIPVDQRAWAPIDLVTVGSRPAGKSPMGDELGLQVQSLQVQAGETELALPTYIAIPPIPTALPKPAWGWFFEPSFAQFDFYPWYLYFSGVDDAHTLALTASLSFLALVLLIPGALALRSIREVTS